MLPVTSLSSLQRKKSDLKEVAEERKGPGLGDVE
jgi:hypothetical protein